MILDTPLTVKWFDTPINDKDNEFFHYVNQEWENLLNTLNRIRTMAKETKEKQLEHGFSGLNERVDLCIYFDGNTISVSSING